MAVAGAVVLLAHAESKESYGKLYRRIVYARGGEPVGCYLYYARRGEIARVLQVVALPDAVGTTLDSLFVTRRVGCVAVRGRAEPELLDPLIARRCVLFHVSAMVVHARDKALLAEVRRLARAAHGPCRRNLDAAHRRRVCVTGARRARE